MAATDTSATTVCSRCNSPLGSGPCFMLSYPDRLAMTHVECLRCLNCNRDVSDGFVVHGGFEYCQLCSATMYQTVCFDCGCAFPNSDDEGSSSSDEKDKKKFTRPIMAMGNLYHWKCFACSVCKRRIQSTFYINEFGQVFCRKHQPSGGTQPEQDEPAVQANP